MPKFKKKALSLYLRTGCTRQLRLNLYDNDERRALGMPLPQQARAGLGLVGAAGYEWQDQKVSELANVFGTESVHASREILKGRPGPLALAPILDRLRPHQFVVEAAYDADTTVFRDALGLDTFTDDNEQRLGVGEAHPDLIQTLPPRADTTADEPVAYRLEVRPDGTTALIPHDDRRLRLRVIDIKLAAEPGAHYFAEVVYYAITLAAWLQEQQVDDRFVVVAAPAVWPGSYDASALVTERARLLLRGETLSLAALAGALESDLEIAPFDVFAPRLVRFFREELPVILQTPWQELPYHVSFRCGGCDFLGYPWTDKDGHLTNDKLHCWPTAEADGHLSRVFGLSRGGARQLDTPDTVSLAELTPEDAAFDRSPTLRARRNVFPARARALRDGTAGLVPDAGGDALMPRWPDLHVYCFLDYDLASAITVTFGLRGFWREPLPFGSTEAPKQQRWNDKEGFQEVFVVETRSLDREREELLKFLRALRSILDTVRDADDKDADAGRRSLPDEPDRVKRSTYQIYLWDEAQRRHLVRIVGRHLAAILDDPKLRDLAWLFPPPDLLGAAEEASYRSPFTLVSTVVQNTVAVPVPHHYTLLGVARCYRQEAAPEPFVPELFQEPLSDLVPGERVHELWTKRKDWTVTLERLKLTMRGKLLALGAIVGRLEKDLGGRLNRLAAPPVVRVRERLQGVPPLSHLLHEFTRLNAALQDLDAHTIRAMSPHEREARFKSAHLTCRLDGEERTAALDALMRTSQRALDEISGLLIYKLAPGSRDLNARPGDIGYALSPRDQPGFLSLNPYAIMREHGLTVSGPRAATVAEAGLTSVSVEAIERVQGFIALKLDGFNRCLPDLERAGIVDLSRDVMLDPVEQDFFTPKLKLTLKGLGFPEAAIEGETALQALGLDASAPATFDPQSPAATFLWDTVRLATAPTGRDTAKIRTGLEARGVRLNDSQWDALTGALAHRLSLVWGPPGTGKSTTLGALVAGALLDAHHTGRPLRVLIASNNYAATDNVLFEVPKLLAQVLPDVTVPIYRVQGKYRDVPDAMPAAITPLVPATKEAPLDVLALQDLLSEPSGLVVVGAIPHQIHNLALASKNKSGMAAKAKAAATQRPWFDLLIVDEASQVDVASATILVSKAAEEATFVLAGDDLQLPPIHPADAPTGLESHVGSLFEYVRHVGGVAPLPLNVNYRSSDTLVTFTRTAGYDRGLHAHSPNLRLNLPGKLPTERPADWPEALFWTPDWARLLDPAHPATCFVYNDETSAQANDFEAAAVAALLWLLRGRMGAQLWGECGPDGPPKPESDTLYPPERFWERAVGVVTPHRAQMSKVVGRLHALFPDDDPERIRAAVDTVERFQGQQRDVIIASFGVGDPDLVSTEEEFLYDLRRFNVLASRARAKLIVFVTRSLVDHLAGDSDVLDASRLLKYYVEGFCRTSFPLTLGYREEGRDLERPGILRLHGDD